MKCALTTTHSGPLIPDSSWATQFPRLKQTRHGNSNGCCFVYQLYRHSLEGSQLAARPHFDFTTKHQTGAPHSHLDLET